MAEFSSFNLDGNCFTKDSGAHRLSFVLPEKHVLLHRTPFSFNNGPSWDDFFYACRDLRRQIGDPVYLFLDATWDPVTKSDQELLERRCQVGDIFHNSKIGILSAKVEHYYANIPGIIYFPMFLIANYHELEFKPRRGRIGCLNRRNAPHRVWLMHNLLSQELIDPGRDVYSIAFSGITCASRWDIDIWLRTRGNNEAQLRWPERIETHPDNFPNDYSISHPAWHTGISIITETEPGEQTIITEKTGKGILSKSCFSIYMSETGYRVLEDLGFEPRFFPEHAENHNVEPILKICREIPTEAHALEYRQMHMDKINHNFEWFGYDCYEMNFKQRPWFNKVWTKFQQELDCL